MSVDGGKAVPSEQKPVSQMTFNSLRKKSGFVFSAQTNRPTYMFSDRLNVRERVERRAGSAPIRSDPVCWADVLLRKCQR